MDFNMKKINDMISERNTLLIREEVVGEILVSIMMHVDRLVWSYNTAGKHNKSLDETTIITSVKPRRSLLGAKVYQGIFEEFLGNDKCKSEFMKKWGFNKFEVSDIKEDKSGTGNLVMKVTYIKKK